MKEISVGMSFVGYCLFFAVSGLAMASRAAFQLYMHRASQGDWSDNLKLIGQQFVVSISLFLSSLLYAIEASIGRNAALHILGRIFFDLQSLFLFVSFYHLISTIIKTSQLIFDLDSASSDSENFDCYTKILLTFLFITVASTNVLDAALDTYVFDALNLFNYLIVLFAGVALFLVHLRRVSARLEEIRARSPPALPANDNDSYNDNDEGGVSQWEILRRLFAELEARASASLTNGDDDQAERSRLTPPPPVVHSSLSHFSVIGRPLRIRRIDLLDGKLNVQGPPEGGVTQYFVRGRRVIELFLLYLYRASLF